MKFLKYLRVEHTNKLFQGKFKYKAVISSGLAGWFRGGNLSRTLVLIESDGFYSRNATNAEKQYAKKLLNYLKNIENWQVRVETPYISLYFNEIVDLESVVKFSRNRIKYVAIPDPNTECNLTNQTVIVKKLDFDYKVFVGATNQNYLSFVTWCNNNNKIKLPKRAARDLSKDYSPGGGYFYVKDDKSLTMVKMFLGRTITRVENVIRA